MLLAASVTDSLVNLATHVVRDLGLSGVALLTGASGVVGVPGSEATMLFGGFNVFEGHLTLLGIVVFGVLGDVVGAAVAYLIGFYGRLELLERHGQKLHISRRRLALANHWFDRHGSPVILFSRWIPGLRPVFPYAAGVSQMPFGRFLAFATLGSIPWIIGLGLLGRAVGSGWQSWRHNLEYVDYAVAAILLAAVAYLIVRRVRRGHGAPAPDVISE